MFISFFCTFQISGKTLSDLELIKADSEAFSIVWRRVRNVAPRDLLDEETVQVETVIEPVTLDEAGEPIKVNVTETRKVIPPAAVVFYKVR